MNNNLPMKEERGIFNRIKRFFRNLFYNSEDQNKTEVETKKSNTIAKQENDKKDFIKNIQIGVDNKAQKEIARNELFEEIRKKPERLKELTNKQLERLSEYYDQVIEKNEKIIEAKKAKITS